MKVTITLQTRDHSVRRTVSLLKRLLARNCFEHVRIEVERER